MKSVERLKLWIMILAVLVFGLACYAGSTHIKYETPEKKLEYDKYRYEHREPIADDDDAKA